MHHKPAQVCIIMHARVLAAWRFFLNFFFKSIYTNNLIQIQMEKPTHVKPSFYSHCYYVLKEIALKYGYNLVIHGSLNRDLDLIACPWSEDLKSSDDMIIEFAEYLGGKIQLNNRKRDDNGQIIGDLSSSKPHGRIVYIIDLNRESYADNENNWIDPQYYLDISVMPAVF